MHQFVAKTLHMLRPSPEQAVIPALSSDCMAIALADPSVRSLAIQCAHAAQELVRKAGFTGFVQAAIAQAAASGASPEAHLTQQLAVLKLQTHMIDTELAFELERRQANSKVIAQLLAAAGSFSAAISHERESLRTRIAMADQTRNWNLLSATGMGLTHSEAEMLGKLEPSDQTLQIWRERVQTIGLWLEQLDAFGSDPLKNTGHLAGLPIPGFDFAVKAATPEVST